MGTLLNNFFLLTLSHPVSILRVSFTTSHPPTEMFSGALDRMAFWRPTPEEMLKKNKRLISTAVRRLEVEITGLEQNEKRIKIQIKQAVKKNDVAHTRMLAKQWVKNKKTVGAFKKMSIEMQQFKNELTTMMNISQMGDVMKNVTKIMRRINNKHNLGEFNKMMMDYQREFEIMGMKQEMMNDALDEGDSEEVDEETDLIISQIVEEASLKVSDLVSAVLFMFNRSAGQLSSSRSSTRPLFRNRRSRRAGRALSQAPRRRPRPASRRRPTRRLSSWSVSGS